MRYVCHCPRHYHHHVPLHQVSCILSYKRLFIKSGAFSHFKLFSPFRLKNKNLFCSTFISQETSQQAPSEDLDLLLLLPLGALPRLPDRYRSYEACSRVYHRGGVNSLLHSSFSCLDGRRSHQYVSSLCESTQRQCVTLHADSVRHCLG